MPRDFGFAVVAEFSDRAAWAMNLAMLHRLLASAARDLGFAFHALVEHAGSTHRRTAIMLHDYPRRWTAIYMRDRLGRIDPVQQAATLQPGVFAWANLPRLIHLSDRQHRLLLRARRSGLGEGFTVPLHGFGQRPASCTFVTASGMPLPEPSLLPAQLLAHRAWSRALEITGLSRAPLPRRLSRRQRECVALVAQGKTDWEIGRILDLSEETVTKYLKGARERYGVARRSQLPLAALLAGEIEPDDQDPERDSGTRI